MKTPIERNQPMTDNQYNSGRNDLIDLMIEKAKRLITDTAELEKLIQEYEALKK